MELSKQQGLNELFPNFVLSKSFPACKVYGRVKSEERPREEQYPR